ncbi:sensor histidine kinase [Denitromonas iodatirespirans]|uniref:histidine kinase n=1 Tax=Denitromonas iodatirespirans TaxID=2795389 RepID=A0A944HBA6_DENI1|nr:sensor histidine kinase [Denitromonas iodatirespirans]MBT0961462.1 sensor histidine kinase [Denitromonas iodatirespirans]
MPSLKRRLLRALAVPILIGLLGGLFAYRTASEVISDAYDANLLNLADGVAQRIRRADDMLAMDLAAGGQALLRTDQVDTIFYRVRADDGKVVAGDADLPPPEALEVDGAPAFYDAPYRGETIRGVRLHRMIDGRGFHVTVAETLGKRHAALLRLMLGFGAAVMAVGLAVVAIVRFAIPTGLRPIARLTAALSARAGNDLDPIDPAGVPLEIRGVVMALNAMLLRLASARDEQRRFLQNAAHQLRTPLANLQMQVELLGTTPAPEQLARVARATTRVTRLANQLLALARAEAGTQHILDARPVDLAPLIDDMLDDWLARADRKQIDLGVHRAPAWVRGDGTLLRELLANLVENALKYAPTGGRVSLHCVQHGSGVLVTVEDDGPGIAEAERERVFKRFYRTPGSVGSGVGLGLAIVREIVTAHQGRIALETPSSGHGLRVRVELPGEERGSVAA